MSASLRLADPLEAVRGIGPARAAVLRERGLASVEDLLFVLPTRYEDRRRFARLADLDPAAPPTTSEVVVESVRLVRTRRRGLTIVEATVRDSSGTARVRWFNQPFLTRALPVGVRLALFGRVVDRGRGQPAIENPEIERLAAQDAGLHTGRIVPVYRRVGSLNSRALRTLVWRALETLEERSADGILPRRIAEELGLPARSTALRSVHFPEGDAAPELWNDRRSPAHRRIAFEEMFALQAVLAVLREERDRRGRRAPHAAARVADFARRLAALPFELTAGQRRALDEVGADLRRDVPMNRLLQGDVGSGKTIVALLAAAAVADGGRQAAILAPTEALAEQHERAAAALFARLTPSHAIGRLTGSMGPAERREVLAGLGAGRIAVAIGTHALLQSPVKFADLGLVVVDEQQRFGVTQRAALGLKGSEPDVLVLSATPIPRSVAMTWFGDLDVSRIRERPPGRGEVRTVIRESADRPQVYRGVRQAVDRGGRAFVIAPAVDSSTGLLAVRELAEQLRDGPLAGVGIAVLHGGVGAQERRTVLRQFRSGERPVLVATTVVEVGIDIPEANVLVVEQAERFGLAQLHQLRGRIGRGPARSWCVLVPAAEAGPEARARLDVLAETGDGFEIAERDLELRGPGDVLSIEQHGPVDLSFLSLAVREAAAVERVRHEAQGVVHELGERARHELARGLRAGWRDRLAAGKIA